MEEVHLNTRKYLVGIVALIAAAFTTSFIAWVSDIMMGKLDAPFLILSLTAGLFVLFLVWKLLY